MRQKKIETASQNINQICTKKNGFKLNNKQFTNQIINWQGKKPKIN